MRRRVSKWELARRAAWLAVAVFAAVSCGDDEGDGTPPGEMCFQAGALDADCICTASQPRGIRRCQQNLVWDECVCPDPPEGPCTEGEPVPCPACNGQPRTTTCLRAGTFDCPPCGESSAPLDASFDFGL